jgi:hypothetical protein
LNQKLIEKFCSSSYSDEAIHWNPHELDNETIETVFYLLKKNLSMIPQFESAVKAIIRANQRPLITNWVRYSSTAVIGCGN